MTLLIRQRSRVGRVPTKPPRFVLGELFFYYVFFNIVFPPEIVATHSQQNHLNMSWVGNFFYYAFLNLVLPAERREFSKQFHKFQTH